MAAYLVGERWRTEVFGGRVERLADCTHLVEAAQLTVGELQQTVVEKLKASGGGKLTEAQAAELGELLKAKTLQMLSTPVIDLLTAAAVDVQALITGAGEDWIGKIKSQRKTR